MTNNNKELKGGRYYSNNNNNNNKTERHEKATIRTPKTNLIVVQTPHGNETVAAAIPKYLAAVPGMGTFALIPSKTGTGTASTAGMPGPRTGETGAAAVSKAGTPIPGAQET